MIDTYLKVYDGEDSCFVCVPEDEPRVNAAVSRYVDSGCTHDTLLDLTMVEGPTIYIRASDIRCWFVSTPGSRERRIGIDKESEDEYAEHRRAHGIWDEPE